jgi:thiosulfate sulfurtransferase
MGVPEISVQDALKRLQAKTADFVDVRDPKDYGSGHIPGAKHLGDQNIQEFIKTADKSRPLIVNCYRGNSSQGATAFLLDQGFKEVRSLKGGFEGWRGTGMIE